MRMSMGCVTGTVCCGIILLVGCPTPGGPAGNGNQNENAVNSNANGANANLNAGGGNANGAGDGNANGAADQVLLTLILRGPANGDGFGRVHGIVNEGPQDHASIAARNSGSDFLLNLSAGQTETMQTFSFTVGDRIALVAQEAPGGLTSSPPPDTIDQVPLQFDGWTGNNVGGATGSGGSNPATLFFTITEDTTVEANFAAMTPIFVRGMSAELISQCNVLINIDADRFIIPPEDTIPQSGVAIRNAPQPVFLWGFMRDGTELSLEVRDGVDNGEAGCTGANPNFSCFVFVSWSGDCSGSGKTCVLTYGTATDATVTIERRN